MPSAKNASQLKTVGDIGFVLSTDRYGLSLEELLRMVALPAGGCTYQDKLNLGTLRIHVSPDAVYALTDLVTKPSRAPDVSIEISGISRTIVIIKVNLSLKVPTLDAFKEEGCKVMRRVQAGEGVPAGNIREYGL